MVYTGYNIRSAKLQGNQPATVDGGCGNKTAPWGLNGYGLMTDGDKVRGSHTACPLACPLLLNAVTIAHSFVVPSEEHFLANCRGLRSHSLNR